MKAARASKTVARRAPRTSAEAGLRPARGRRAAAAHRSATRAASGNGQAALAEYHRKRDFGKTPEPAGGGRSTGDLYVIQKHAASRLHYDFRLELDGTLKSWAVPKGPSLDPSDKRLAVHVEDHPVAYGAFEGIIPEGQYGAGRVLLWDRGTWTPEGDARKDYEKGRLTFELRGEKLRGRWNLVRLGGRRAAGDAHGDGEARSSWLLIKGRDAEAREAASGDVLEERPESVATGKTIEEITGDGWRSNRTSRAARPASRKVRPAGGARARPEKPRAPAAEAAPAAGAPLSAKDIAALPGARAAHLPASFRPQLASFVDRVPEGEGWLHEIKYDGYRFLCRIEDGKARLISRNAQDWTARFPEIAAAAPGLGLREAIIDGELVALDARGVSSFQALQNALTPGRRARGGKDGRTPLVFFAFDLPFAAGHDLCAVPLAARKEALRRILERAPPDGLFRYSDHLPGSGAAFFQEACAQGLEGVVSKRADGAYMQSRSRGWLKTKCLRRQEFVIAGWTDPQGARTGFGSLLLGCYQPGGGLAYCGRVGTGFDERLLRDLHRRLEAAAIQECPFAGRTAYPRLKGIHWVRPELVAEVRFTEWTRDGVVRHPSFEGLREDKDPREIVREQPAALESVAPAAAKERPAAARPDRNPPRNPGPARNRGAIAAGRDETTVAGVRLTHPGRVMYEEQGLTKLDIARYYEAVARWILPHVADRPLAVVRCPQGRKSACFFQKNVTESLPPAIGPMPAGKSPSGGGGLVIRDVAGLVSLVQIGVLEIHPWGSRVDAPDKPDRLILDLDPDPALPFAAVVEAALGVRARLEALGLRSFLKTTGGKGLHVVVPLVRRSSWIEVKAFAHALALEFAASDPRRYVAVMSKERRKGRIFVDYLRNARGATAVAAYSTRAREGAPVATPLAWEEARPDLDPRSFDVRSVPERLGKTGDPWTGFFDVRQSLPRAEGRRKGT